MVKIFEFLRFVPHDETSVEDRPKVATAVSLRDKSRNSLLGQLPGHLDNLSSAPEQICSIYGDHLACVLTARFNVCYKPDLIWLADCG
jgi:hypothetical protein